MRATAFLLGCCALALVVPAASARAQQVASPPAVDPAAQVSPAEGAAAVPADQKQVYIPADFAQYAPRSALDSSTTCCAAFSSVTSVAEPT